MSEIKKCIYCGTEHNLTKSDIFPDALTNARIFNTCVCKEEHNSKFAQDFEAEVAESLAYLTNKLNIKSSKSNSYSKYTVTYDIEGEKYERKISYPEEAFKEGKIMWNGEKNDALGDPNIIKKISEKNSNSEMNIVDVNKSDIIISFQPDIKIFFCMSMYRQVAKIAYEWYCSKNSITDYYDDFKDIVDFITTGNGDKIVEIIDDDELYTIFDEYCTKGSHCLLGYISKMKK